MLADEKEIESKLKAEQSEIESKLKNVKLDCLKNHVEQVKRLSKIYFELDLKSEYQQFIEKYINPIGIEQFLGSTEITFFVGLVKFNNQEYDESLRLIERSLENDPKNYKALNTLACIKSEINPKNKQEYIELLKQVLYVKEDYYRSHLNIAIAYEEEGDFENSDYHYRRSIELKPKLFKLYQNYVYFLISFEKYNETLELLKSIEDKFKEPENQYNIWILYSECHFDLNNYQESLDYAEKCVKIDPNKFNGYFSKGNALFSLGNYQEAIDSISLCIEMKMKTSKICPNLREMKCDIEYYNLGLSYMQLSEFDKALIYFRKSLEENQQYNNSYRQIMRIYSHQQKYSEFLDTYEESILVTSKKNKSMIITFLVDHGHHIPIARIDTFFKNILINDMNNIKIVQRIFEQMNKIISSASYTPTSKSQIYHKIFQLFTEKYLRFEQSLQILVVYNKSIKDNIKFQSKYNIWDLLID